MHWNPTHLSFFKGATKTVLKLHSRCTSVHLKSCGDPPSASDFMYILTSASFRHLGLAGEGLILGSVQEKFEFLEFPNVEFDSVRIWIPGNSRMDSVAPPRSKMRANWVLSANRMGRGGGCGICSIPSSIWTTVGMDGLAIISSCEYQHCNIRNIFTQTYLNAC